MRSSARSLWFVAVTAFALSSCGDDNAMDSAVSGASSTGTTATTTTTTTTTTTATTTATTTEADPVPTTTGDTDSSTGDVTTSASSSGSSTEGDTAVSATDGTTDGTTTDGTTTVGPDGCSDGEQNGMETGVDCGGPNCKPCSSPGLVINEIDYDQSDTDNTEFVELLNTSPDSIDLDGLQVVFLHGDPHPWFPTAYLTIDLGPAGMLAPGQYLVLHSPGFDIPGDFPKFSLTELDVVQDGVNGLPGPGDGLALVDTVNGLLIDALAYEGEPNGALEVPGVGVIDIVEGAALPVNVADSNRVVGSLSRLPDGHDANNAATDWAFTTTPTPGAANVP